MGTKMQVLGGKIKFLSYKLSTQFGLVAQLVRATDCLYSGNANMWYERHPYKMEIVGSTPTTATMKKAISDYYKKKGFECVYINTNKEPRRVATLHKTNYNTSMSYAKYLYTSHLVINKSIWRSQVQALAGPQTMLLQFNGRTPHECEQVEVRILPTVLR